VQEDRLSRMLAGDLI